MPGVKLKVQLVHELAFAEAPIAGGAWEQILFQELLIILEDGNELRRGRAELLFLSGFARDLKDVFLVKSYRTLVLP